MGIQPRTLVFFYTREQNRSPLHVFTANEDTSSCEVDDLNPQVNGRLNNVVKRAALGTVLLG